MNPSALPVISSIKGTDNISEFVMRGVGGLYRGNTNIDHLLDPEIFNLRALFVNPLALKHTGVLLEHAEGLLLNCISDPDINLQCLAHLNKALKAAPRPIINHPRLVIQTRRNEVAKTLAGIEGLVVPKVIRVDGHRLHELRSAIAEARMQYPLLVRSIGAHDQANLLKIDSFSQLTEAEKLPGKGWYVTEFYDYRSADGLYRNYRFFVFATGKVVARYIDIGPDWKVGIHVREPFMLHRPDLLAEVAEYVDNFESMVGEKRLGILQEIRTRLGLDYIGLDCNLLPSGDLLLFETNIVMNARVGGHPGGKFSYLGITKAAMTTALTELLLSRLD
jgi:hypothetical protein